LEVLAAVFGAAAAPFRPEGINLSGSLGDLNAEAVQASIPLLSSIMEWHGFEGLRTLDISRNECLGARDDEGFVALSASLPVSLTSLDISHNDIGDKGVATLVAALCETGIAFLKMCRNLRIGVAGATALGMALPQMHQLRGLECTTCTGMRGAGAVALAQGFAMASRLARVDLWDAGFISGDQVTRNEILRLSTEVATSRPAGPLVVRLNNLDYN
jgi:hypothetical protein